MRSDRQRENMNKGAGERKGAQWHWLSGGAIVMNRWWGKRRLSLFLWVSLEPTPYCVDRCADGPRASSPRPSPGHCCQRPLVCAQKLTHLSAFVLCYFWTQTQQWKNCFSPRRITFLPPRLVSFCPCSMYNNVTSGNAVMFGLLCRHGFGFCPPMAYRKKD